MQQNLISIIELQPADLVLFKQLLSIFLKEFEHDSLLPEDDYLQALLEKPDFRVYTITKDDEVIGGLTLFVLDQYYQARPIGYIYDIAISQAFQRKGFGKSLLNHVLQICKEQGFEDVFLQAEQDDRQALSFYQSTLNHDELLASQFTWSLNK